MADTAQSANTTAALTSLLAWQMAMGARDALGSTPGISGKATRQPAAQALAQAPVQTRSTGTARPPDPAKSGVPHRNGAKTPVIRAENLARQCMSVDEIVAALQGFDGCGLKETATNLCVHDGNPQAPVMLIGEAPGAEEDRRGKPFVGPSGQLLDRMMAWIGLNRGNTYITNVIYWRPPGNRPPTADEIAVCLPFLQRQIEIIQPKMIVFAGGTAAKALLNRTEGVTRLRGRWFAYQAGTTAIPACVAFHPAYLLRQPLQKRLAWRDMLSIREKLAYLDVTLDGERPGAQDSDRNPGTRTDV